MNESEGIQNDVSDLGRVIFGGFVSVAKSF